MDPEFETTLVEKGDCTTTVQNRGVGADPDPLKNLDVSELTGKKWSAAAELIGALFDSSYFLVSLLRSKALSTGGGIFPLPTSYKVLVEVSGGVPSPSIKVLSNVCKALNSLYGCVDLEGPPKGSSLSSSQIKVVSLLFGHCKNCESWESHFPCMDWNSFFKTRKIDYAGDEVLVAKGFEWANVAPAIPEEVAMVDIREVVRDGCLHYITHFTEYLLPKESQTYTKPPKVMVSSEAWPGVCQGLLNSGICCVIPEDEIYQVQGKPLLNGMFAVSKNEWQGNFEVCRLIMNLIPLNNLCRSLSGDVSTLPSWATMSPFFIQPTEDLLISSEDVKCYFYLFRLPPDWIPFVAFNKVIPEDVVPPSLQGRRCYLASRVLPMGFVNSVSIAQHIHRNIAAWAGIRGGAQMGGNNELRKDQVFPQGNPLWRVYLDNFDMLEKVDHRLADVIKGVPCESILALREEYLKWNLPRHPKKGVAREFIAEVQGAMIDGRLGVAYPKPEKILKYTALSLATIQSGWASQRELQVIGGGLVYLSMFRRPLLSSLNAIWEHIQYLDAKRLQGRQLIPDTVRLEVARFLALVPLARMNFRLDYLESVTASDASSTGGGITVSRGLTTLGCMAANCPVRGDRPEAFDFVQILTIGLFDGIGALRVACDALGLPMIGHISVEQNPSASRVLESQFPGTEFVADIMDVTEELVKQWACRYSQAGLIIIGAGPPCQGVSSLSCDRKGALRDSRTSLFLHVPRVRILVQAAFPWCQVRTLMENVFSMDVEDRASMTKEVDVIPYMVDAGYLSLARRPRLYWCDWEMLDQDGVSYVKSDHEGSAQYIKVEFQVEVDCREYLLPGWKQCQAGVLPTFTTSRPRKHPGRGPAGIDRCLPHELQRWEADSFRFPPYQYRDEVCLQKQGEFRVATVEEREVILGFPKGFTAQCAPKSEANSSMDLRLTLLGNSWSVTVVLWMLSHLTGVLGLSETLTPKQAVAHTQPGGTKSLQTLLRWLPISQKRSRPPLATGLPLVQKLAGLVSLKGEDILLSASSEQQLRFHRLRASLPSKLWQWRTICGWAWKSAEHINVLEARAVLATLKWRVDKQGITARRCIHLVDSLVVLHCLSRGRSSSKKMRRTVLRISAYGLAADLHPLYAYVNTKDNPADKPSRVHVRKKWVK